MAKVITKAVTRFQKFLAAIAGDGTAPNPITSDEKLMYNIAEKMNEGGGSGGGGVLVVHDVDDTLDKTWAEIDAVDVVVLVYSGSEEGETFHLRGYVTETTMTADGDYGVRAGIARYLTDSADGYPVRQRN